MFTQSAFCSPSRAFLLILVLALTLSVVVGCTPEVSLDDVYRYVSDCPAEGAVHDIQVSTTTDGNVNLRPLDEGVAQTLVINENEGRAIIRFGNIEIPGVVTFPSGQRRLVFCYENPGSKSLSE